jgi:D-arabinose 1-dehydrogenase-like Zn-dependent alcohol dehydrogenase
MFCFKIPDRYPLAKIVPLMCAGITVYTPMIRYSMNQPSKSLGVIGLGGLGHMAFEFGKAFGLKVTVFRRVYRRELKPLISSAQIILSYHLTRNRWRYT